jgi:hypothetical protein
MGPGNRNYNQVKERGGYRTRRRGEGIPRQDKAGDCSPGTKMFLEPTLLLKSPSDHRSRQPTLEVLSDSISIASQPRHACRKPNPPRRSNHEFA